MRHEKRESDHDCPWLTATPHCPPRHFTLRTSYRHPDNKRLHDPGRRHTAQDTPDLALPHHEFPYDTREAAR